MGNEKHADTWQYRKVYFDINGEPAAYAKIPDTHRVVSVELLRDVLSYCSVNQLSQELRAIELRAIIDNKKQS